ncbi:methyl-accepting chemotaxis protein [Clostridium taeniosporum]|uniref:Methyl-accepting chemotaxis protein n=1 Tax=Clostridium taeniosporum TaxID=394958 RepID=A0A1D7XJ91_9CLOT|nr:methyl-accepting chemotaxis protein [Clostridium taeniosporum]AOR23395.1 methyl-accepting chemotaxis protein [Clostridium taeniosporum]
MKHKKGNFWSMKNKLISSLMSICLIPLIIFSLITYFKSAGIVEKNFKRSSQEILNQVSSRLDNYFIAIKNPINLLSENSNFKDIYKDINNETVVRSQLQKLESLDKDILGVYFGTESGKFINYPEQAMSSDYNHKIRPWYKSAVDKKGEVIITDVYIDATTGKLVVTLAKAVENEGNVIGVIGADLSLDGLTESISSTVIGQTGYIYIATKEGNMVIHKNKDYINTDIITKQSYWDEAKNKSEGIVKYTFEGQDKLAVYKDNDITGWKIFSGLNATEITKDTNAIIKVMGLIMLIVLVISIAVALFISKGILKNLNKLKEGFSKAAKGDLSTDIEINSKDEFEEIGEYFNYMINNISNLISNVKKSSNIALQTSSQLASMSEETSASLGEASNAVNEIAQGGTRQAQNALNCVDNMEDLSNRLNNVSNSTMELSNTSDSTKNLSVDGIDMVKTLIEKSMRSKEASIQVGEIVIDVNENMEKINKISETIASITEQTNLLSLNASIEAARAGEAGKGFAIVAEEIRKLADESSKSTEEIKKIIGEIKDKSNIAVNAIEDTKDIVEEQEVAVSKTEKIFNSITNQVMNLIEKIKEIEEDTIDISGRKDAVLTEIEEISSISEETASASEEVSAATQEITGSMAEFTKCADELQNTVEELETEIGKFKIKQQ